MSSVRPTKRPRTANSTSTSTSTSAPSKSSKASYTGFKRIEKYNNLTLPDGTHRRKLEKIKKSLIHKAKLVKSFKKLKTQTEPELSIGRKRFDELARLADEEEAERRRARQARAQEAEGEGEEEEWDGIQDDGGDDDHVEEKKGVESGEEDKSNKERDGPTMHPDRVSRSKDLENAEKEQQKEVGRYFQRGADRDGRAPRRRPSRFDKEVQEAAKIAAEREKHQRMLAEREAERKRREIERERWKKAVNAKTRTGQIKLGKQSGLLLDKVKRQMAEG